MADPPAWWIQGPDPVIAPGVPLGENGNHAVANIGQAKWMARRALETIRTFSPALASEIELELVGSGQALSTWVPAQDEEGKLLQKAPLLVGQLKAIAAPFYAKINAHNTATATWLAAERTANGTESGDGIYPWTATNAADDNNKGVATLGQLKAVFSLHFTESGDGDGVSDFFELVQFGTTSGPGTGLDTDQDGKLDATEAQAGGVVGRKDNPALQLQVVVTGN